MGEAQGLSMAISGLLLTSSLFMFVNIHAELWACGKVGGESVGHPWSGSGAR